jgi:hypothetical protein
MVYMVLIEPYTFTEKRTTFWISLLPFMLSNQMPIGRLHYREFFLRKENPEPKASPNISTMKMVRLRKYEYRSKI